MSVFWCIGNFPAAFGGVTFIREGFVQFPSVIDFKIFPRYNNTDWVRMRDYEYVSKKLVENPKSTEEFINRIKTYTVINAENRGIK